MRQVVLDTETTGLDPNDGDRIVEIGSVELIDGCPTGEYLHSYLNPGYSMPAAVQSVHGLSDDFLADKPNFADIADRLRRFLHGAELIIHNAPFDIGFLNAVLRRRNRPSVESQ